MSRSPGARGFRARTPGAGLGGSRRDSAELHKCQAKGGLRPAGRRGMASVRPAGAARAGACLQGCQGSRSGRNQPSLANPNNRPSPRAWAGARGTGFCSAWVASERVTAVRATCSSACALKQEVGLFLPGRKEFPKSEYSYTRPDDDDDNLGTTPGDALTMSPYLSSKKRRKLRGTLAAPSSSRH